MSSVRWLDGDHGYTTLEPSTGPSGGRDIVRHDPETGATEILVVRRALDSAPGRCAPLGLDDYAFSADRSRLLIFTNSQRVWRHQHAAATTGCSTAAAASSRSSAATPRAASLMHAKFCARRPTRSPMCAPITSTWKTSRRAPDHAADQLDARPT